ncbi:hypothetical protein Ocin01_01913 [Orchesella cincta]|uniref:Uncharacterized protein n=1 Tax=Orchesella cincta TaxID=48709 RepID=A0A1D2NHL5_ORCCI|nr:hypothetical protein Ocin01_01913 [Orchesella cincta]
MLHRGYPPPYVSRVICSSGMSSKMVRLVGLLVLSAVLGLTVASRNPVLSLEESKVPDLRVSEVADPRSSNNLLTSAARSVNLSFFIPAFSLFALASQLMPQMFPSLTTTTTSSRRFPLRIPKKRNKRRFPCILEWEQLKESYVPIESERRNSCTLLLGLSPRGTCTKLNGISFLSHIFVCQIGFLKPNSLRLLLSTCATVPLCSCFYFTLLLHHEMPYPHLTLITFLNMKFPQFTISILTLLTYSHVHAQDCNTIQQLVLTHLPSHSDSPINGELIYFYSLLFP